MQNNTSSHTFPLLLNSKDIMQLVRWGFESHKKSLYVKNNPLSQTPDPQALDNIMKVVIEPFRDQQGYIATYGYGDIVQNILKQPSAINLKIAPKLCEGKDYDSFLEQVKICGIKTDDEAKSIFDIYYKKDLEIGKKYLKKIKLLVEENNACITRQTCASGVTAYDGYETFIAKMCVI